MQWKGLSTLARLIFTPDVKKPALVNEMVFPTAWLEAQADGSNVGKTNAQVQTEVESSSLCCAQADKSLVVVLAPSQYNDSTSIPRAHIPDGRWSHTLLLPRATREDLQGYTQDHHNHRRR